MDTTTLTAVTLAALLVSTGFAFAAPVGAADASAGASGHADATVTEDDGRERADEDATSDRETRSDEAPGLLGRFAVAVSAAVGTGTGTEARADGDASERGDRAEVRAGGHATEPAGGDADAASGTGEDARERGFDRIRSIHDRVRAIVSGGLEAGLGVGIGGVVRG